MTVELVSFDGTEACHGSLLAPARHHDLHTVLAGPGPFAARGAGLSYCQTSAGDGVTTISTRSFNRFLAFDPDRLQVTLEPGVTVGALVRFAVGRGAWFPVLPGHPAITVGGCVGFSPWEVPTRCGLLLRSRRVAHSHPPRPRSWSAAAATIPTCSSSPSARWDSLATSRRSRSSFRLFRE